MTGAELIAAERTRQIEEEGWTAEHDDDHDDQQLVAAALCYAGEDMPPVTVPPEGWPFEKDWWKPSETMVRNLVKAGALIAAEIDRLQRLFETGVMMFNEGDRVRFLRRIEKPATNEYPAQLYAEQGDDAVVAGPSVSSVFDYEVVTGRGRLFVKADEIRKA